MDFSQRISQLLEEHHLKQCELAKALYLAPNTINGYIKGSREPDHRTLVQIAKFFSVTTDYLLGVTTFPKDSSLPLKRNEDRFLWVYRNLRAEKQELLKKQAYFYYQLDLKNKG